MVTFKRYLRFSFPTPLLRELELALIDAQGQPVAVQAILDVQCDDPNGPALLFDEQQLIPQNPSQLNSTYFDEIYHARTAWEHKNGMSPYEVTHPPLGKIIIMLGISLFGMTPFGWRVAGACLLYTSRPHDDSGAHVPLLRHGAFHDEHDDPRRHPVPDPLFFAQILAGLHHQRAYHLL